MTGIQDISRVKVMFLSPSTLREYKRQQKHDFPELMPLPIQKITQENIQIAVNRAAGLYSPKTVHNMHGLLVSVFCQCFCQIFRVKYNAAAKDKEKKSTSLMIK